MIIKFIIAVAVLWFLFRISKKKDEKIIVKKDTKIDFKKVKDAEFEDNEQNYNFANIYANDGFIEWAR